MSYHSVSGEIHSAGSENLETLSEHKYAQVACEDVDQERKETSNVNIKQTPSSSSNWTNSSFRAHNASSPALEPRTTRAWAWWAEVASCFGMFSSLAALVITLAVSRNKPLPQLPYSISLNTIISFESTVYKGFLTLIIGAIISQSQWLWFLKRRSLYDLVRYDAAGRGPFGSLLWILKHHVRSPLTTLAALVMILSLIVDPFVQQLVGFVNCESKMTGLPAQFSSATIPRTNYYSPLEYHLDVGATYIKVPVGVQDAISAGVEGTPQSVDFNCYSGNCSFSEPYSTLGFCHYCEDLSDQVQFNKTYRKDDEGKNLTGAFNITSFLPDGFAITSSTYEAFPNQSYTTANTPLMSMRLNDSYWAEFIVAKTVRSGCEDGSMNGSWACQGYGAAKCTLRPCVKTFQANITGNVISETLLEYSDPLMSWNGSENLAYVPGDNSTANYVLGLLDLQCTSDADKELIAQNYTFNSTQRWIPFSYDYNINQSMVEPPQYPGTLIKNGCLYLFETFLYMSIYGIFLSDFFDGTLEGTIQISDQLINAVGPRILEKMYDQTNGTYDLIDSTFEGMATYLTNYIRENGNAAYSQPAEGTVLHYATCVQVRWWWLAFPVVLAFISLVLLVWIIGAVSISKVPAWKSSPLAIVYRGPNNQSFTYNMNKAYESTSNVTSDRMDDFEAAAKKAVVRLGGANGELRLENLTHDLHGDETRM
ncbi:uncharacterized protein PV09_02880 [Verruconis gallopava]|uniref:Uncharacterized protein n=1 Tax=Verruconis gallopava TaxID=253628 RepID=A0A0D2AHR5_9PEZI|nr:uncharacterized protein PV09_02880 [Verruconis gallopava]KIW06433.1 hypothetical protein PV09_02880 [Verruconis gallopava]